jgi:hypothetical protein
VSRLVVDSRTLLAIRETLGRLHHQLLGVHAVVGGYEGMLGGRALEAELEQFCVRWHFGIIEIGGQIEALMHRLLVAAAAYERIEHRVGSGTTTIGPRGKRRLTGSGTTTVGRPGGRRLTGSGTTTIGPPREKRPTGSGTTSIGLTGSGTTTIGLTGSGTTTIG